MRRRSLLLLAGCLASCASPLSFPLEVPAGIRWVAVLVAQEGGWAGSLERIESPGSLSIELPQEGSVAQLRGYSDEAVEKVAPTARVDFRERLRVAQSCEPALPQPQFLAAIDESGPVATPEIDALARVTADWITRECKPRSTPLAIVTNCAGTPCYQPAVEAGCGFHLDATACGGPKICGAGLLDDPPSFATTDPTSCQARAPTLGADATFECRIGEQACSVDLRLGEPTAPPITFQVTRRRLFEVSSGRSDWNLQVEGPAMLLTGFVSDLAVVGDRLLILHAKGQEHRPDECLETRFEFLDLDTLETVAQVDPPFCVQRVAPDPVGGGFLGVGESSRGVMLTRFDPLGVVVEQLEIGDVSPTNKHVPKDVVLLAGEFAFVGFVDRRPEGEVEVDTLVELRGRLFARTPYRVVRERFDFASAGQGFDLGFADAEGGYGTIVNLDTQVNVLKVPLQIRSSDWGGAALFHPRTQSFVFGTYSNFDSLLVVRPNEGSGARAYYHDGPHSPLGLFVLPSHPEWIGVTLTDPRGPSHELRLGVFDPTTDKFLRGSQVIGTGVATRFEADGLGRVYTLLPWTAEVLRIEVTP